MLHGRPFRLAYGIIPLILLGCLAACASSTTRVVKDPFSGAPISDVGQTVKLGANWEATVNSVTTSAGQADATPPDSNTMFLLVDMTFKNLSTQDLDLYTVTPLILRDGDGQRYTQLQNISLATPPDGTIAAGTDAHGVIVFAVPTNETHFLLAYYTGNAKDPHAIWMLTASAPTSQN